MGIQHQSSLVEEAEGEFPLHLHTSMLTTSRPPMLGSQLTCKVWCLNDDKSSDTFLVMKLHPNFPSFEDTWSACITATQKQQVTSQGFQRFALGPPHIRLWTYPLTSCLHFRLHSKILTPALSLLCIEEYPLWDKQPTFCQGNSWHRLHLTAWP